MDASYGNASDESAGNAYLLCEFYIFVTVLNSPLALFFENSLCSMWLFRKEYQNDRKKNYR